MLFNLVKKDFILAKKYLLVLLIFAVGIPIFITFQVKLSGVGFLGFFCAVIFIEYMFFVTVSTSEDKYKGSALLCATPYTRNSLVKAKYLSLLAIFIIIYLIYTITALIAPIGMEMLNFLNLGVLFLITTIIFGVYVPVQYKFGYEKTRYIFYGFFFILIFEAPSITKLFQLSNISFCSVSYLPQIVQSLLPWLVALVIAFVSMTLSLHIYCRKNL